MLNLPSFGEYARKMQEKSISPWQKQLHLFRGWSTDKCIQYQAPSVTATRPSVDSYDDSEMLIEVEVWKVKV